MDGSTAQRNSPSSEHTALLLPNLSRRHWHSSDSSVSLIIPVAIAYRFAMMLPSTTTFRVIELLVCRLWYASHDPGGIPADGRIPDTMCSVPAVAKNYATALMIMDIIDGIGSMIGYSTFSLVASKFGRKPAILVILAFGINGSVFLVSSQTTTGYLEAFLLAFWVICQSLSAPLILAFVTNLYVIDLVRNEDRTSTLSALSGWAAMGGALSFAVGGLITTRSANILPVYYTSVAIMIATCVYIWFILPESFPRAKRDELYCQRAVHNRNVNMNAGSYKVWQLLATFALLLEPLQHLRPRHNHRNGRDNRRLVYCAIHVFLVGIGDTYSVVAMVLYLTTQYSYTPAETGYVLTMLNLTNVFVLTVIIPQLVRLLRPFYRRGQHLSLGVTESPNNEETMTEKTDCLDVHIIIVSWVIEAFAYILLATMATRTSQLAAVMLIGCGAGRVPVFRSLVVASVDPLKQGEILAAIEMVGSIGAFLSPIVMGSILTITISTLPQLVFYVHGAIVISAAAILLLIKDSDHSQNLHEG